MADNLIASISQFLTPSLRATIASALGLDPATADKALGAAIPAVLSSLGNVAATPGGAAKISDMISSQDMSVIQGLGASLESNGPMDLINGGTTALSGLLGDAGMSNLTTAISKVSGANTDAAQSVLGLAGPIVSGVIGQQDPSNWADASSISNFFASQKSNIAAALPGSLGAALGAGAALSGMAASRPNMTSAPAAQGASSSGGFPMWLIIVILVLAAALAWYLLAKPQEAKEAAKPAAVAVEAPKPVAVPAAPAVPVLPTIDLAKSAATTLDSVKSTLGSITDVATANAALPQLASASSELDKLSGLAANLPAPAKAALTGVIGSALPAIKAQIEKITALPGVGDIAKPALDGLTAKLDALSK